MAASASATEATLSPRKSSVTVSPALRSRAPATIASSTRLAGDEPPREAAAAAHAVARGERLQRLAAGEDVEESLRSGLEHQWVRGARRGDEQVLDGARVVAQHGALADAEAAAALDEDDVAVGEHRRAGLDGLAPLCTARFAFACAQRVDQRVGARLRGRACVVEGRIAAATIAVGSTLYSRPIVSRIWCASVHDVAARLGIVAVERDRLAEASRTRATGSRPRSAPSRRSRGRTAARAASRACVRQDVVLEHEVVGDRQRHDDGAFDLAPAAPRAAGPSSATSSRRCSCVRPRCRRADRCAAAARRRTPSASRDTPGPWCCAGSGWRR